MQADAAKHEQQGKFATVTGPARVFAVVSFFVYQNFTGAKTRSRVDIDVNVTTEHDDKEVDTLDLQHVVTESFVGLVGTPDRSGVYPMEPLTCEMLARLLAKDVACRFKRAARVRVSEDGNTRGAEVVASPVGCAQS